MRIVLISMRIGRFLPGSANESHDSIILAKTTLSGRFAPERQLRLILVEPSRTRAKSRGRMLVSSSTPSATTRKYSTTRAFSLRYARVPKDWVPRVAPAGVCPSIVALTVTVNHTMESPPSDMTVAP
jgi:hypothetical protein